MEKPPPKQKRTKDLTKEDLLKLDKDQLIDRIFQLQAHNIQLKNIISKKVSDGANNDEKKQTGNQKRPFDFSRYHQRRVLLQILYFGWNYNGLAVQEDSNQTIEHHLFYALTKACLIESRENSGYHRCGRTDKGVSSFGQVISITLRSKFPPEQQNTPEAIEKEIQYCKILNRLLPKDIKAIAWMAIPEDKPEYSARFDCKKRQYKYYFPRASLDIEAMRAACSKLVGSNDFRNLCKMDVGNGVVEFRRNVFSADIVAVDDKDTKNPTSMFYLLIEGNAFLWHQIRCIMAVLLLVGQEKETPDVITELLDIEKHPRKPQYNMALDLPLNLFHCSYDLEETSKWSYDTNELSEVLDNLRGEWTHSNIQSTMIKDVITQLERQYSVCVSETADTEHRSDRDGAMAYVDCLIQGVKSKVYTPLLKRLTCSSLEERIQHYSKKRKVECQDEDMESK